MGWRDITNSTNERTVVGGVFPVSAVGNNLPVWGSDSEDATLLPALLSSFVCDYAARFKVGGTHLNFFVAEQIPVLPPECLDQPAPWSTAETVREWLLPRVLELTYSAWTHQPFVADCGYYGPPFHWDDNRRFLLRCELDAAFFHLYLPPQEDGNWRPAGRSDVCPRDETPEQLMELKRCFSTPRAAVDYVMDTFPIVRRKDQKSHGEHRTRRIILEICDAMQESVAVGESYKTRLDPPPAHTNCFHTPQGKS